MAKQDHVIKLSEVPAVQINAPEGSAFGGSRQRVGAAIGAQKLGYSFFSVPPGKSASISVPVAASPGRRS